MRRLFFLLLCCASFFLCNPLARATTYTVTKLADTNDGSCNTDCSLREAIDAAKTAGGHPI